MQTRRAHSAQEKRRWLSITGPGAGEVSGHGSGVERCSAADRRFDHRGAPEGSGVLPRAFAFCQRPGRATRTRRDLQQSGAARAGRAAGDRTPAFSAIMGPPEPGGDTRAARSRSPRQHRSCGRYAPARVVDARRRAEHCRVLAVVRIRGILATKSGDEPCRYKPVTTAPRRAASSPAAARPCRAL